ncbi:MAG: ABC transporter ATP-binding protein [Thaumarchaeota archaeon]|nr:ABC transporter ATP-binding protein [Nitrososphaerota archaeon]
MTPSPLVEARDLVKEYGQVRALDGLNLRVNPGDVYGLLGPNGAGKTTTLRILSGLEVPTSGSARVAGFDPATQGVEVKRRIGYVAESAILYESLTPREYFEFVASTRQLNHDAVAYASSLAQAFDAEGASYDVPIGALSLGTKQKVAVIAALMHRPPLLLLDEPLNGLDAKSSKILKELMLIHVERKGAVIFSTHIMEVAESVCTRIGIINDGRLFAEGTMGELRSLSGTSGGSSLEDVFLKLTNEERFVEETLERLRSEGT